MSLRFIFTLFMALSALSIGSGQVVAQELRGHVEPEVTYELRFGVAGVVKSVAVQAGNVVLPGTLLIALDPAYYQAHKTAMDKDHELMAAQLEEASRAFERDQVLFDEGSMSVVELELSRLAFLKAEASHEKSKAAQVAAGSRLKQSRLYAPVAGKVVQVNAYPGQSVWADGDGNPSLVFASSQRVVRVVSDRAQNIPIVGAEVDMDLNGESRKGMIGHIDFSSGEAVTVTIQVEGDLPAVGTEIAVSF